MARAKQYAERVNIIKRIKLGSKWPFASVVKHNGRIVRDHVCVAGREEHHPEGRYYLEWYERGKRRRKPVPKFENLLQSARSKSIELNALKPGLLRPTNAAPIREPARLTMNAAIDDYLEYIRKHRSLRTYRTYRPVLNVLLWESYTKTYVDEVTGEDILKFTSDCFDQGLVRGRSTTALVRCSPSTGTTSWMRRRRTIAALGLASVSAFRLRHTETRGWTVAAGGKSQ